MDSRISTSRLITLVAAILLTACAEVQSMAAAPGSPDAELARQSRALQRSMLEGAAFGALTGGLGAALFGDRDDVPAGVLVGAATGAAAGYYVGHLQQNYASNEARLEQLRADLAETNAETAATIRTMRAVLDRQRRDLAAVRAGAAAPSGAASADVERAAQANLANMQRAIAGAESRYSEFNAARALNLGEGQAGVDREVAELGQGISQMRVIATNLAEAM